MSHTPDFKLTEVKRNLMKYDDLVDYTTFAFEDSETCSTITIEVNSKTLQQDIDLDVKSYQRFNCAIDDVVQELIKKVEELEK